MKKTNEHIGMYIYTHEVKDNDSKHSDMPHVCEIPSMTADSHTKIRICGVQNISSKFLDKKICTRSKTWQGAWCYLGYAHSDQNTLR